jgi:ComF family protein
MVAAYYEEGPIKEAIHNFKYNNVTELAGFLSDLLAKSLQGQKPKLGKDIILTAVPMHFLKKAQRGYNQAEMLADVVAEQISAQGGPASGWKLQKSYQIIKKIRKTKSQVSKSGKKRRENLKNSFKIIDKNIINNRNIIIVDDVTTTGTTLEECAKVLKVAGAKKIWGLVIARG